jgi:Na+/H+ antiporter NhaC
MLKSVFASCLLIFCAFFFLLTEFNETSESANDPCRSASSDAEDIFADVDEFDILKVLIYISQIIMMILCRLCTCES